MTRSQMLCTLMAGATVLLVGCATKPKPIPATYYQNPQPMKLSIDCPREPQLIQRGGGGLGLIGGLVEMGVGAGRKSEMQKRMEGIKGDAVTELVRQKMTEKLEPHFEVSEVSKNLTTEVKITQWGWFVPITELGIKTGSYQFMLNGTVNVYDTAKNREHVGYVVAGSQQPLGNDPTPQQSQEALLKAAEDFSNKAMAVILQNKPATKAP